MTTVDPAPLNESSEKIINNDSSPQIESERYTRHSPLVTLLIMSIGPLNLLIQAIGESIDLILVGKRFNKDPNSHAVEMIGFATSFFQIMLYPGMFFGHAAVACGTNLIGAGDRKNAAHLFADILRISLIFSIVYGIPIVFLIKPYMTFIGCPDYMIDPMFYFILPLALSSPLINWFSCSISYLQMIGQSGLSALVKVLSYVLQCGLFTPLLLFAIKVPTSLIKLSTAFSTSILAILFLTLIFRGKFSLKVDIRLLLSKFTKYSYQSLILASPTLLQFLCYVLPPMLILKSLTSVAKDQSKAIGGVFAVFNKIILIVTAVPGAISSGYLSAATHAYGANNIPRLIRLMLWSFFICVLLYSLFVPVMILCPTRVAKLFLADTTEIKLTGMILPIPFYTIPLQGLVNTCVMTYIIVGKPLLGFIPLITQVLIQSIGCNVLAKHFSDDMTKIMHIYNISDVVVFILNAFLMIWPIIIIKRKARANVESSTFTMHFPTFEDTEVGK